MEAYCDQRLFSADYRQRWYPPDADFVMRFLLEVIEADYYLEPRPPIDDARPWMRERLAETLEHFESQWKAA